ncbi:DUF2625 domain-containing protein [Variovorax sp. CY25R-8]|jgi:hypothetical protein|uniref:DUF2625 domain-containing protein n=1 Tax=Variovorax sp. CY25R-8 TaxID=2855501 RepID=UPI0021BAD9C8|nr:DUF2625 domain-containing protein [Variovorax sp. CY25R-8]MCT8176357.1 DUF2625 domain-containing protein [Variovorax sp. CY25R-8]
MRPLHELLEVQEPAMAIVEQWAREAELPVEILPPSTSSGEILVELQVTTRSVLGAIAYGTGGILIDRGWLRMLGSGHHRLTRNIAAWNVGRSNGFCLVADDAVGGFFAINGGAFGDDQGVMYYLAPDTLEWENLGVGHAAFTQWAFSKRLHAFYDQLRWTGWEHEVSNLTGDQCFNFYPFLHTEQGSTQSSSRRPVPISEQYAFNTT